MFVTVWYVAGVLVLHLIQGIEITTALYIAIQVLTTVGYGDVAFEEHIHWFMTFWVLSGIVVVATFVNDLADKLLTKNLKVLRRQFREMECRLTGADRKEVKARFHRINHLVLSFAFFSGFVGFGAVFYSVAESCSCGYGNGAVVGCKPDDCENTGGITKNFAQSVYMSVITLTTVGFGDFEPKSEFGRIVAIFWMLFGVLACANFVSAFSDYMSASSPDSKATHEFSTKLFHRIDKNNDGALDRAEFALFMLAKKGLLQMDDLDHFSQVFTAIKKHNNDANPDLQCLKRLFTEGAGDTELQRSISEALADS